MHFTLDFNKTINFFLGIRYFVIIMAEDKKNDSGEEEFNDSDYEDKYPDDLPSDKELQQMIKGDATKFGMSSVLFVLAIAAALYAWAKYF